MTGSGNYTIIDLLGNNVVVAGAGNDFVWTGSGSDNLQGGAGNDILAAGCGKDQLRGDDGRDILIGGLGADRLSGNSSDDILIAGYTSWDGNRLALSKVLDEWTSGGNFAARFANVKNGTGLTGGYRLNGDDGATQTVFNGNDVDRLTGNSD